jgi:hypothetical protein
MDDPVRQAFEVFAENGAIGSQENWLLFVSYLAENGVIVDHEEISVKRMFESAPITFTSFVAKIKKEFRNPISDIQDELSEFESFEELLDESQNLDSIATSQLLRVIADLEAMQSKQCHDLHLLAERQTNTMAGAHLAHLVYRNLIYEADPNPFDWKIDNGAFVEGVLLRRRVRSVRPSDDFRKSDPFGVSGGFGVGCMHMIGTQIGSHGENRSTMVDVWAVEAPKHSTLGDLCWQLYEVHRELTVSKYFLDVYGIDDSRMDSTRFFYEFAPCSSLSALLSRAARPRGDDGGGAGGAPRCALLTEASPLFQHWIRELLSALADMASMGSFEVGDLSLKNVLVGHQGAGVRLGRFERARRVEHDLVPEVLLARWADLVDDLSLAFCGSELVGREACAQNPEACHTFSERDLHPGIYVRPGQQFAVALGTIYGRQWCFPEMQTNTAHAAASPPVLVLHNGEEASPIPLLNTEAGCLAHATFTALRPGRVSLVFSSCPRSSRGGGNVAPATNIQRSLSHSLSRGLAVSVVVGNSGMSPVLSAILRCCRARKSDPNMTPPLTFAMLRAHDYFAEPLSLDQVMSEFERAFS